MAAAETIWIVGYRFAPADSTFLDVVARAVARRQALPRVGVISLGDPGKLLPRLRNVLKLPDDAVVEHCFDGLAAWIEHGFCG